MAALAASAPPPQAGVAGVHLNADAAYTVYVNNNSITCYGPSYVLGLAQA
jgi:hypothetical protein